MSNENTQRSLIGQVAPDIRWVIQTLFVVGIVAAVGFIRVNWFEAELSVSTPELPRVSRGR